MADTAPISFDALAALPLVRQYEQAFFKATGVALKLQPAGSFESRGQRNRCENGVCWLVAHRPDMGMVCWKPEPQGVQGAGAHRTLLCFAGLQSISAQVSVAGQHVATWVGDHMLSRRATAAELAALAERFAGWGMGVRFAEVRDTFVRGRVIPSEQFRAMGQLLSLFAEHLGRCAEAARNSGPESAEPRMVRLAKEFVAAHLVERFSLGDAASAANVSPFHFCRVFRASTGLKFTEYVARQRVERAKALLANRSARVTEVAYEAGFGSIPQFNAVFRKLVGGSPTQYRAVVARENTDETPQNFSSDTQAISSYTGRAVLISVDGNLEGKGLVPTRAGS